MKTLIITSKNEMGCYERIVRTWFTDCERLSIVDNNNIALEVLYKFSSSHDCCVCLPPSVDPELPEKTKTDIVVDEVKKIIDKLQEKGHMVNKEDLFLLIHSGDLFPLGDARRENGLLFISDFPKEYHDLLEKIVADGHIFQFRHDRNDITIELMGRGDADIATLFNRITKVISEQSEDED